MAAKIRVEGERDHLKKSIALLLIRRLLAEGIYNELGHLIAVRRLAIRELSPDAFTKHIEPKRAPYVPEIMPLGEIPGLKFEPPTGSPRRRWLAIPAEDVIPVVSELPQFSE